MKTKLVVFILVIVAMVSTTLFANDIVNGNGEGTIILKGNFDELVDCTIEVYEMVGSEQYLMSSTDFQNVNFYKVKIEAGSNYLIVFNNGKFTKHLRIENVKPRRKWYLLKRETMYIDVDFKSRKSAKVRQNGNSYHFDLTL